MNKKIETIIVILLYLGCLWLWTLPFQKNRMPYGDVDSSTHFGLADYMAYKDKSMFYLPYFFNKTYYSNINNGKIWYMPQIHTSAAILQIMGGERIIPIFLFWAIICSSIVITVYFLVRKLYGFLYGLITAILFIFSFRDIMWYLWGQYLQVLSFAFVPLVMYCFYKYLESTKNKPKPIYIYLTALLIVCQFFIHPQAILLSVLVTSIYTFLFILKLKKFPFRIKDILVFFLIIVLAVVPFLPVIGSGESAYTKKMFEFRGNQIKTLFRWYPVQIPGGVPPSYYSYKEMHGGYWTLPFLFAGLFFLFLRRRNKDLLMLSWLISFYLSIHQSIIGLGRAERFLEIEAHVIYAIVVIGFFFIISLIKSKQKKFIKYALVFLLILFVAYTNGIPAYNYLKNSYTGILRINPQQYEAAEWMRENLPEDKSVYELGHLILAKKKWMRMLSNRFVMGEELSKMKDLNISLAGYDYILMDYHEPAALNMQNEINILQQWEKTNLANSTLLYNKGYTRVYKIG